MPPSPTCPVAIRNGGGERAIKHYNCFSHEESSCFEVVRYSLDRKRRKRKTPWKGPLWSSNLKQQRKRRWQHDYACSDSNKDRPYCGSNNRRVELTPIWLDFISKQVQSLLALIETTKSGYVRLWGSEFWLLHSGTSCHMVGTFKIPYIIETIELTLFGLPHIKLTVASEK